MLQQNLDWPQTSADLEDATFDWTGDELKICQDQTCVLKDGLVRQLRSPQGDFEQPWGIFLVEFADDKIHRTALRQILRGLIPYRRRDPLVPAWKRENLLFICTTAANQQFTFAHFRGETPAKSRLATFGWEQGSAQIRTLCEHNLPALRWPEDPHAGDAWVKAWASAFDKEPLTREFFKRFDEALKRIKEDLENCQPLASAQAYSKAQLLLERLIFLYFLQKRGWLNRRKNYLIDHFKMYAGASDDFTYYEKFLEVLFWTLSTAPGTDGSQLEGIPFLNGGLFDDDEFAQNDKRRKINPPLRIRNSTFTFVFDHLLEAFNFTVREDTPLDQDVAVDPEMLGKVFESIILHAEEKAEYNAPDLRKGTGSYYTPRIVVHFICREALRQYLKGQLPSVPWEKRIKVLFDIETTDSLDEESKARLKAVFTPGDGRTLLEILRNIKMCDPAVGSGAFPVGLLHELVNLRYIAEFAANGFIDPLRRSGSNWIHDTKANIVENCLYGVDLQQQAVEICRLRLWLSLIVDYDLGLDPFEAAPAQFKQALKNISQLPNLEMNFHRGDSLLDTICDVPVLIETNKRYEEEYERFRKLGRDLHKARKSDKKRSLRVEILRRRLDLSQKVIEEEIKQLRQPDDQLRLSILAENESDSANRRRIEEAITHLQQAMQRVDTDRATLEKIAARPYDSSFYPELRKLEGAEFDAPFNFAWRIDYADIFNPRPEGSEATLDGELALVNEAITQQKLTERERIPGGFDLILGNPPFVTARNPIKRELYRERWKRVCHGKYHMLCPFFELSFGLLRPGGQLGFIVSNAFAKREFGKPLVENFFPTVELQKVVDCSGLMFPGHGTPTCIVFGRNRKPDEKQPIRVTAILPGGGDLRTPPEQSPLWATIEEHNDQPGYMDTRIAVSDMPRNETAKWPWNFESTGESTKKAIEANARALLRDFLSDDIGFDVVFGARELYVSDVDFFRRSNFPIEKIIPFAEGDFMKNHVTDWQYCHFPYDKQLKPHLSEAEARILKPWKTLLSDRPQLGGISQVDYGLEWFEYYRYTKRGQKLGIIYPEITTHNHFFVYEPVYLLSRTAPVISLISKELKSHHLVSGLLNSSASLLWLKQICFSKRESSDGATDTYLVFAGGKVQQLPVPEAIADNLRGNRNTLADRLTALSQACWTCGQHLPSLALRKLFEMPGEAYHEWNSSLSGYITPNPDLGAPFGSSNNLLAAFTRAVEIRERLRAEMIALQEEMDWLVYAAYGLIPTNSPAVGNGAPQLAVGSPLLREQRPFVLWAHGGSDFNMACELIPSGWPEERKALWRARLEVIRDNEHIRRIEQPVYKRRWDEQWKVGNRWQCGPVAYDAELADAFYWWLSEKAEWWLEHKANGGPVELNRWMVALLNDTRIQAAWAVVQEALKRFGQDIPFHRFFKEMVKEQTVPDNIPWAVPWEDLRKEMKIPTSVVKIRGKLNVPRERFRLTSEGRYLWAGERR
jgi:type I restriction-modification system DNA methylase subunit